ncbi:ATPase [Bacteroidia bacterium]|nr:ATPase [Bacteroidia bacterium]
MYINRLIDKRLHDWANAKNRKPLLLRGARQVGKSSSVRHLAENFENLVEINFEKQKAAATAFEDDLIPTEICNKLSTMYQQPIIPGKTLLFLDEIQACPNAISALRFFYEDYPQQHIIAAGSLLEFALAKISSFGVGRITNLFMYPFSFSEFMRACGYEKLDEEIKKHSPQNPIFEPFHSKIIEILRTFLLIGGMPEAVARYVETQSIYEAQNVLSDLIATLKSDFEKYREKVPLLRLNVVFDGVVNQAGQRVIYSNISKDYKIQQIKECVELLRMAGLIVPVIHTAANGIPLGAESNLKKQKLMLLDTGVYLKLSGLNLTDIVVGANLEMINKGKVAEMFAALELQKSSPANSDSLLYFWHRESNGSTAEVDFLIQQGDKIVPIEVKSGTSGKMQSLHLFLREKNIDKGIRCSLENFVHYDNIDVYPLYAISTII